MPFWLRTNQYGIVPLQSPNTTLRAGAHIDYDSLRLALRRISIGGGVQVVGNTAAGGGVLLPEAYVKARLGIFELYGGRRREVVGLYDTTLSSGSYAWSGNALPVPKIQLEVRDYQPIGFTKGWIALKASYAHGWLGGRYVQRTKLHQKSLYGRLGKPNHRIHLYGGVNHQVVWGGYSPALLGSGLVTSPYLPSTLRDYISLVSGLRAVNTGVIDQNQYTDFDLTNRIGNHLGSVDVAFEYTSNTHSFYLYRQNPYETGALFYGVSLADGLNGLRIRSNKPQALIQHVLVEFLNTTSQGGPEFVIDDPQRRGKVDYFNHAQFRDGWSYQYRALGTPFITPALGPNGAFPFGGFTNNNRVQVYHFGIAGSLPIGGAWLDSPITYESKLSISQNFGRYDAPFRPIRNQLSGIMTLSAPLALLGGLHLTGSVAYDRGALFRSSVGGFIGLRKTWSNKVWRGPGRASLPSRSFPGSGGVRE